MSYIKNYRKMSDAGSTHCKNKKRTVYNRKLISSYYHLSLPVPEPVFDQLQVSILSYDNPYPLFEEKFGPPVKKVPQGDRCFWQFENGLLLSQDSHYSHFLVIFQADEGVLQALHSLSQYFPPHPQGNPPMLLRSAEIAFDMSCDTDSYNVAERMLKRFVALAHPKNLNARLKPVSGDGMQKTADGAENGNCTNYFTKLKPKRGGETKPIPCPSWTATIYPKAFAGKWHIRCEITLQKDCLARYLSKHIPRHVLVNRNGRRVALADFFTFARFNWQSFTDAVHKIADKKSFQKKSELEARLDGGRSGTASEKKRMARRIARFVQSDWLERRIGKKEFEQEVHIFAKPSE